MRWAYSLNGSFDRQNLFGAPTLTLADEIACAATSLGLEPSQAAAAMVFLDHEPGESISTLAYQVGLSHAGTARLIDRLELERLAKRRQHPSDHRVRFLHLITLVEEAMGAMLRARDRVISSRVSPIPAHELSTLGACAATANATSVHSKMMAVAVESPLRTERYNITVWA